MGRYELEDLERYLKLTDEEKEKLGEPEPVYDDTEQVTLEEVYKLSDDFKVLQAQLKALHPMRVGTFKRFWKMNRMKRSRREKLILLMDQSDHQAAPIWGEGFKTWREEMPEAVEFLEMIEKKRKDKEQQTFRQQGNTIIKDIKAKPAVLSS